MIYIQLVTDVLTDPRVIKAGPEGFALWVKGLLYAKQQMTDGAIPREVLPIIAIGIAAPESVADSLVKAELWEPTADGWAVPAGKWAKYQMTKAQVEVKRAEARERQRKSREARELASGGKKTVTKKSHVSHVANHKPQTTNHKEENPPTPRTWEMVWHEVSAEAEGKGFDKRVLGTWFKYKSQRKAKPYTPIGTSQWCAQWFALGPGKLEEAITFSIAQNYEGITVPRQSLGKSPQGQPKAPPGPPPEDYPGDSRGAA